MTRCRLFRRIEALERLCAPAEVKPTLSPEESMVAYIILLEQCERADEDIPAEQEPQTPLDAYEAYLRLVQPAPSPRRRR